MHITITSLKSTLHGNYQLQELSEQILIIITQHNVHILHKGTQDTSRITFYIMNHPV